MILKRIFDAVISFLLIALLIPFSCVFAILIRLNSEGPVFYISSRIGKYGKIFKMFKFRTMYCDCDCLLSDADRSCLLNHFKLDGDPRITPVGRWLRRLSIDEVPQLLNVVKGDMSLVGPRPKLPEEIELYGNSKHELLTVQPGITGYWQVFRKNANSDKIMRNMDIYYIRNMSWKLDVKLLLLTCFVVFKSQNY